MRLNSRAVSRLCGPGTMAHSVSTTALNPTTGQSASTAARARSVAVYRLKRSSTAPERRRTGSAQDRPGGIAAAAGPPVSLSQRVRPRTHEHGARPVTIAANQRKQCWAIRNEMRDSTSPSSSQYCAMSFFAESRCCVFEYDGCRPRNRSKEVVHPRRPPSCRPRVQQKFVNELWFFPGDVVIAQVEMRVSRNGFAKCLRE